MRLEDFIFVEGSFTVLLFAVAGLLLLSLLLPKPKVDKPEAADDIETPLVKEGSPQTVLFGTVLKKDPFVVWKGDLRIWAVRKKASKK